MKIPILCFLLLLLSCYSRRYNGYNGENEKELHLPIIHKISKRKLYLTTYPPADLSKGLIDYRKRFNQWPKTFTDLVNNSYTGWQAARKMLETNYDDLNISYSSVDTLVINYTYMTIKKEDFNKMDYSHINVYYKGKYIYIMKDSTVFIDNKRAR